MKFAKMKPMTVEQNELVEKHYWLVNIWISRLRCEKTKEDAFQNGVLGLMRAAQIFDDSKGVLFPSYASKWIWYAIFEERKFSVYRRILSCSEKAITDRYWEKNPTKLIRLDATVKKSNGGLDLRVGETIADENAECPEDAAMKKQALARLAKAIKCLPLLRMHRKVPADIYRIVARRLFMNGETLDKIGDSYGVSRERIRQIGDEVKAMLAKQLRDCA